MLGDPADLFPYIHIPERLAGKFHPYRVGDQVVFQITGNVETVGKDTASIAVTSIEILDRASSVQEAARRAENELTVRTREEHSVG